MEVLAHRQSIRKYTSEPVSRETIEKIVDIGRLAATARNVQPWHFVVVTDAARRKEIAGIAEHGKFLAEAPVCIAVLCEDTKYYLEDGCAAVQNLLNAAAALDLGSCWIAGDKKPYAEQIACFLGAPAGMKLIALVAVGHPAERPPRAVKKDLKQVLHWEKF